MTAKEVLQKKYDESDGTMGGVNDAILLAMEEYAQLTNQALLEACGEALTNLEFCKCNHINDKFDLKTINGCLIKLQSAITKARGQDIDKTLLDNVDHFTKSDEFDNFIKDSTSKKPEGGSG